VVTLRRLVITDPAKSDLRDIRDYTFGRYGLAGVQSYDALLKQALRDIRDEPYRPGSKDRSEIGDNIRSYHIAFSRHRAGTRVKSARHLILYFLRQDDVVVSRVLHDARDLARHLPDEHRTSAQSGEPHDGKTSNRRR
jgi:toxin ParE1/3/4